MEPSGAPSCALYRKTRDMKSFGSGSGSGLGLGLAFGLGLALGLGAVLAEEAAARLRISASS